MNSILDFVAKRPGIWSVAKGEAKVIGAAASVANAGAKAGRVATSLAPILYSAAVRGTLEGNTAQRDAAQRDKSVQTAYAATSPALQGGNLEAQKDADRPTPYMVVAKPKGLIEPGNLPIWTRPTVQNADGSHSSEFSFSFGDDKGREVLVPTIVNGRFLTPDGKKPPEGTRVTQPDGTTKYVPTPQERAMWARAQAHYEQTGEHLGIFDNSDDADAYANKLHNRGARKP
jgi:hypothetical protein